jgi:hypothetical protein
MFTSLAKPQNPCYTLGIRLFITLRLSRYRGKRDEQPFFHFYTSSVFQSTVIAVTIRFSLGQTPYSPSANLKLIARKRIVSS